MDYRWKLKSDNTIITEHKDEMSEKIKESEVIEIEDDDFEKEDVPDALEKETKEIEKVDVNPKRISLVDSILEIMRSNINRFWVPNIIQDLLQKYIGKAYNFEKQKYYSKFSIKSIQKCLEENKQTYNLKEIEGSWIIWNSNQKDEEESFKELKSIPSLEELPDRDFDRKLKLLNQKLQNEKKKKETIVVKTEKYKLTMLDAIVEILQRNFEFWSIKEIKNVLDTRYKNRVLNEKNKTFKIYHKKTILKLLETNQDKYNFIQNRNLWKIGANLENTGVTSQINPLSISNSSSSDEDSSSDDEPELII